MTGGALPVPSPVDGASVDALLDSGASGLRYFDVFLPRASLVDPSITQTYAGVCALYDRERGMDLDVLVRDGERIASAAGGLDAELTVQDGCLTDLQMSWQGSAADGATRQFLAMATRATSLASSLAEIAKAHAAAADLLRSVISTKAQFVAGLDPSNIGGKNLEQIDAMIDGSVAAHWYPNSGLFDRLAGVLPNLGYLALALPGVLGSELYRAQAADQCRNWLDTVFVPDVLAKLAAFSDLCDATGIAVRQCLGVVSDAMQSIDDSPFRVVALRPDGFGASAFGAGGSGAGGGWSAPGSVAEGGAPPMTAPAGSGAAVSHPNGACPEPSTNGPAGGTVPGSSFTKPMIDALLGGGPGSTGSGSSGPGGSGTAGDELVQAVTGALKSATGVAEALLHAVVGDENNAVGSDSDVPVTPAHAAETGTHPGAPAVVQPPAPETAPHAPLAEPQATPAEIGHIEAELGGFGARVSLLADGHVEFTTSSSGDHHGSPVPIGHDADPAAAVTTPSSAVQDEADRAGPSTDPPPVGPDQPNEPDQPEPSATGAPAASPPVEPESGSAAHRFTDTDVPAPAASPDARLAEAGSL